MLFGVALSALGLLVIGVAYTLAKGIGVWGNNQPVGWAFDIINFVWWIGIGHAGTLISAILLLFQQKWRTSHQPLRRGHDALRRHVRGPLPAAAHRAVPGSPSGSSRTPAPWALAAVPLAAGVGRVRHLHLPHGLALFWYVGLIPDLAALRDSSKRQAGSASSTAPSAWAGAARAALAQLQDRLPAARRPVHAAGALGAHHRVLRLRHLADPRLARHHLPALLRGRRRVHRLRHGGDADGPGRASTWACGT